jgi:ribosomal protein L16 Arg81 hydroxylase
MTGPCFIRDYNLNVPSWKILLDNFNNSVIKKDLIKHKGLGFFVSHQAESINQVKNVLNDLKLKVAHLYFNLTTNDDGFGRHKDVDDVYFWQCQGETKWIFDNNIFYILKKGDLIIVPKFTYHHVIPLSPRAGISMSL